VIRLLAPNLYTGLTIAPSQSPTLSASACIEKIDIPTVMAGQRLDVKEVDDGIWLVSFLRCDFEYIDLEQAIL
jgi:hypothetical protein